ncbi:MAG: hypothetical protein ABSB76_02400 [Streptosporangiaceae bacterium]
MDERFGQSLRRVQRGNLCPERIERRTLGVGNEGRGLGEHLASGRDLRRRQPVGEVMPGAPWPRDRPIAHAHTSSARGRRTSSARGRHSVQRVQAAEQRAEVAEAARRADRVPPLLAGNRVGPPGDQDGAAVEVRDRLVRRAPLGRELVRRQVAQYRGVTRHRFGALLAGNQRATQSGPSGRPTRHTPRSSSDTASIVIPYLVSRCARRRSAGRPGIGEPKRIRLPSGSTWEPSRSL